MGQNKCIKATGLIQFETSNLTKILCGAQSMWSYGSLFHLTSICSAGGFVCGYCSSLLTSGFSYCALPIISGNFSLSPLTFSSQFLFQRSFFFSDNISYFVLFALIISGFWRKLKSTCVSHVHISLHLEEWKDHNLFH